MYLTERSLPDASSATTNWVDAALADLPADRVGAVIGRALVPGPGLAVALSPTPVADGYEVLHAAAGPAVGPARYAQLIAFDGPRDEAWAAAEELANRRITAAAPSFLGWVRVLRARRADNSVVVLTLAESVEAIEAAVQQILTLPLLPQENPSLLTPPDRVDVYRLMHADLPTLD